MLRKKICTISLLTLSMMITNISPISAVRYDNHLSIKQNKQSTPILEVTFDNETANDISGNNNHGTAVGSVQYVEGIKGKAIHIKNKGVAYTSAEAKQYVDFKTPSDLQFESDSFSIMFWIKQNGNKMTDGSIIGNKDWSTGRNKGFAIAVYDNKQTLNFTANGASRADTECLIIQMLLKMNK